MDDSSESKIELYFLDTGLEHPIYRLYKPYESADFALYVFSRPVLTNQRQ